MARGVELGLQMRHEREMDSPIDQGTKSENNHERRNNVLDHHE